LSRPRRRTSGKPAIRLGDESDDDDDTASGWSTSTDGGRQKRSSAVSLSQRKKSRRRGDVFLDIDSSATSDADLFSMLYRMADEELENATCLPSACGW